MRTEQQKEMCTIVEYMVSARMRAIGVYAELKSLRSQLLKATQPLVKKLDPEWLKQVSAAHPPGDIRVAVEALRHHYDKARRGYFGVDITMLNLFRLLGYFKLVGELEDATEEVKE